MNNLPKKLTLFFILGTISILAGSIYAVILMNGDSAQDELMGICILFSLAPVLLIILIDRLLVGKFGSQKVNKVQFFILLFIVFLWIIRTILN